MKKFIYFFTIFLILFYSFLFYFIFYIPHFALLQLFKTITNRSFSFVAFLGRQFQ